MHFSKIPRVTNMGLLLAYHCLSQLQRTCSTNFRKAACCDRQSARSQGFEIYTRGHRRPSQIVVVTSCSTTNGFWHERHKTIDEYIWRKSLNAMAI